MIKIKISDFYKDAVGEIIEVEIKEEVYEVLNNAFRRENHAEEMRDRRHLDKNGYVEGSTEEHLFQEQQSLEDYIILRMDRHLLQEGLQSLSPLQRERVYLYYFCNLSTRDIAQLQKTNQNAVWKCIRGALKKLKKFFE